jgi:hypothetical protein
MSNPVSLYVASTEDCLHELSNIDWDSDDPTPSLRDYLENVDSDLYMYHLSELFEKKGSLLKYTPADHFMRIILWSWLGEEQTCGISKEQAEEHSLDLAITPQQISKLSALIYQIDSASIAEVIFDENDLWHSKDELQQYIELWLQAFRDAADSGKGVFYKIWV